MHRIFDDYIRKDISMRQITRGLNRDGIRPRPSALYGVYRPLDASYATKPTSAGLLQSDRIYAEAPARGQTRRVPRPRDQWIAIVVPAILDEALFETARRISRDNARWNLRRAEPRH